MEKKPKVLYFYPQGVGKKKRIKHIITKDCMLTRQSPNLTRGYWRCQQYHWHNGTPSHDLYGYSTIQEAILGEISDTLVRISEEQAWLNYLRKD